MLAKILNLPSVKTDGEVDGEGVDGGVYKRKIFFFRYLVEVIS